ncbi:MAG: hypothetical protein HeimC3_23940, partial [Candidatus Heimdallarchaeota archaeon LC_3]
LTGNIILVLGIRKYDPSPDFQEKIAPDSLIFPNQVISEIQTLIPSSIPANWKLSPVLEVAWKELVSTALTDSEISNDEKDLISNILSNLTEYAKILEEAVADNVITPDEQKNLTETRKKIWNKAFKQAFDRDGLSHEENELLFKLIKILKSLENFPK